MVNLSGFLADVDGVFLYTGLLTFLFSWVDFFVSFLDLVKEISWEGRLLLRVGHICHFNLILGIEGLDLLENFQGVMLDWFLKVLLQYLFINDLSNEFKIFLGF